MKPQRRLIERLSSAWPIARRFGADFRPLRAQVAASVALSLLASGVELLRPWPLQWIVDHALIPKHAQAGANAFYFVWTGALAYGLLSVVRAAFDYFAAIRVAESTKAFTRGLRRRLFEKLLLLEPRFHAKNKTGDLIVRLQGDVGMVSGMMIESPVDLGARCFLIAGTVAMLFWIDPVLAAGTLAFGPLALFVVTRLSRKIHSATRSARLKEGVFANSSFESLANVALIQSLGRVDHVLRDFLRASRTSARADCKASRLGARMGVWIESVSGLALAIALLWGSQRVLAGHLSAGQLLAFVAYVRSGSKPVRQSGRSSAKIAKGAACGERLLAVLDAPLEVQSAQGALPAPSAPERLVFQGVSYGHEAQGGRALALSGLTCEFRRGESTLVFGPSGAGKSTLVSLALRLADPEAGKITLDGLDLRSIELGSLRATIAACPQEDGLFGWTIRDNLLLGRPEASEEALWTALRQAAADGFVRELPLGLDTELGSLGAGLSGGQQKRLNLARTFLREAPILILDEPYAGLDAASIARIHRTLEQRSKSAVVIVIAHERDEGRHFDRVVFVEQGRVRDQGSHDELLLRTPSYRAAAVAAGRELE